MDNVAQFDRRSPTPPPSAAKQQPAHHSDFSDNPYEPQTTDSKPVPRKHELSKKIFGFGHGDNVSPNLSRRSSSGRHRNGNEVLDETYLTVQMHNHSKNKGHGGSSTAPKSGSMPRPIGGKDKLGTFSGVFVPTTLNVLSILMFLRFGFILGQSGVVGMMGRSRPLIRRSHGGD